MGEISVLPPWNGLRVAEVEAPDGHRFDGGWPGICRLAETLSVGRSFPAPGVPTSSAGGFLHRPDNRPNLRSDGYVAASLKARNRGAGDGNSRHPPLHIPARIPLSPRKEAAARFVMEVGRVWFP